MVTNRLGLALAPCDDGKSERIVAIDPGGRVARAQVKVAVGYVLVDIGGCPATEAKAGLTAGGLELSTDAVSITVLPPGGREPTIIELPPLDVDASSMEIDQTSDDDPLFEIPAALSEAVQTQELPATAASPQPAQTQPGPSDFWASDEQIDTPASRRRNAVNISDDPRSPMYYSPFSQR